MNQAKLDIILVRCGSFCVCLVSVCDRCEIVIPASQMSVSQISSAKMVQEAFLRAGEMAQQAKAPGHLPDHTSSIPRAYSVEGEN